ncbi:MAG: HAD-IIB family hydrolase [Celeribacter sp.]
MTGNISADRPAPAAIVFSDLDGTLLDHDDYGWEAAMPALDELRRAGIPLILASSKTAAEIAPLRAAMGFSTCPAIVENGAGILPPGQDDAATDDREYRRLRGILDSIVPELRALYQGFGDWGAAEIADRTGLPADTARAAARRQFSEPGLWAGSDAACTSFVEALAERGVTARHGGRFLTLSFGGTKAGRMAQIAACYTPDPSAPPRVLALGDAPNDREMIEAADMGVIIANPHGTPLPPLPGEAQHRIIRTTAAGPTGWNRAVLDLLSDLL